MVGGNSVLIAIVAVVVLYLVFAGDTLESFSKVVPVEILAGQYAQDVRVLASYVGPYLGEIYNYLRVKYNDPVTGIPPPLEYLPTDNDVALQDPLVPKARAQVRSWIDSASQRFVKTYGSAFLSEAKKHFNLAYEVKGDNVLHITLTDDGTSQTFIL